MEIYIENWHPCTLNKLLSSHWATRTARKMRDYKMIEHYAGNIKIAQKKRRVELEIGVKAGKTADVDAYDKVVLDALVKCMALKDDSPEWCEKAPTTFTRGKKYTRIKLIDID